MASGNRCREPWLVLEVIDDKLNDHTGRDRWGDRFAIAQRMPGAPVLQRGLVSAGGIAREAFMKKG